jgi:uncharacterized repeat protein (TIGR01451 family)
MYLKRNSTSWVRVGAVCFAAALAALCSPVSWAAGTAAGTSIGNTATMTYSVNGAPGPALVAVAPRIVVARIINQTVSWQDSTAVPASSPDAGKVLSFLVSNTGNGTETFRLARDNAVTGDQFDPASPAGSAIWLESGAEPGFQASGPNADIAYVPGVNDATLPADATRWVYLPSNIPAGQATGALGRVALIATATTAGAAGAAPGTVLAASGGGQVLVGAGGAQASAVGNYLVAGVALGLAKSVATVLDPLGGTRVMTGSVLTYRLVVNVVGSGVATGVVIKDPLPASLTYVPGSLAVDGTPRTDAADGDDASFAAGTVQATFGNVPAPATRVIEFKATVN